MSKPLDRLTLLETFVRIAERGSISAAARDMGLSQASASRQLKDLELRFQTQLIRRTTHSLALTDAGRELLVDAREQIAGWDALEERHATGSREIKGPLKVIAPVALGQQRLADIALAFQMDNPDIRLTWNLRDDPIRFAEIGCDCWIKIGPMPDDSLVVRCLGRIERLIAASPDLLGGKKQLHPRDIPAVPFAALTPFENDRIRLQGAKGRHVTVEPDVRISSDNIVALHRAALKGAVAAVMPKWFIADDLESGRLVDILPQWRAACLDVNAAYLPTRHQPRRLSAFLRHIADAVPTIPGIDPAAD